MLIFGAIIIAIMFFGFILQAAADGLFALVLAICGFSGTFTLVAAGFCYLARFGATNPAMQAKVEGYFQTLLMWGLIGIGATFALYWGKLFCNFILRPRQRS